MSRAPLINPPVVAARRFQHKLGLSPVRGTKHDRESHFRRSNR